VTFPDRFTLTVTNDLVIGSAGKLGLAGGLLAVSQGNLRLTNGGALYVYGLATNGTHGDAGAKVAVGGDVTLGASSWIFPTADEVTGGGVQFVMNNLSVSTNAGFDADGRGYSRGRGPGGGGDNTGRGGGGYGGKGSYWSVNPGGQVYGLANAPVQPGSAGGYNSAWEQSGYGGGQVWIEASGEARLNGTMTADGRISGGSSAGGGAGGGIFISCQKFIGGSSAVLRADGKNGAFWGGTTWYGGGGGGGRVAVWQKVTPAKREALFSSPLTPAKVIVSATPFSAYLGAVSVTNGVGWGDFSVATNDEATVGTVVFLQQMPPSGTLLRIQ
jgi:hypothetical protein